MAINRDGWSPNSGELRTQNAEWLRVGGVAQVTCESVDYAAMVGRSQVVGIAAQDKRDIGIGRQDVGRAQHWWTEGRDTLEARLASCHD